MLSLFSTDIFTVTHAIVEYFAIDFARISAPNSVYICTSANPRGLTKAGPTSTTSSSKASSLPKAPARKSSAPSATSALVPMPSGSPWLTNSPPLCPAKPTSSTLPRPTASGRISSPKCSPLLHLRGRPTRLTRLPPTPTCWPFMSIRCAPKNRARQGPSTPVISLGLQAGPYWAGLEPRRLPLAHEVLAGNRHDSSTLEQMLEALDKRIGLQPGQTVVVDRGMSGEDNVKQIVAKKLHYLVAEPYGARSDWVEEFENDEDFVEVKRETSPTNPFQHKSTIRVKMRQVGKETHVLCLSSERKEKDRAIREAHEKRLLVDLEKLQKRVAKGKGRGTQPAEVVESIGRLKERYSRVARYYRMEYDSQTKVFRYSLDEAKRARAEKLDGSYLLKTDRKDLSADEAWRIYTLLTRAEAAFRTLKSPLGERPIFHHKEGRVEAHIFLCVLAYHLLISIEKTMLDAGVHTSWATVRETLQTHQVSTVVLPTDGGLVLRIRRDSTPEPVHRELYQKLGISSEIILPSKTWSNAEEGSE